MHTVDAPRGVSPTLKNFEALPDSAQIGPRDMCSLLSCSNETLKRRWKAGVIPVPIRHSHNMLRWNVGEVRSALAKMAQVRAA
jgi:predicted DNA-binding transcriptional regulator AlpA